MICPNCGVQVEDYAKFCFNCGVSLTAEATETPAANATATAKGEAAEVDELPATQFQTRSVRLLHVQTSTFIDLPTIAPMVVIGKASRQGVPHIDVKSLPHSEVVSRQHAAIQIQGKQYWLEDLGSTNGTYVNEVPLLPGQQHPLVFGDRIDFGEGQQFTLVFYQNSPINLKHLHDISGHDVAFEQELMQSYLTYLTTSVPNLKAALAQQNWPTLADLGDQLRIASHNTGARQIQLLAEQIEHKVNQQALSSLQSLMAELDKAVEQVRIFVITHY